MTLTFGSLFAGIGGIDLGLERAGWTGRWQVEWDPFCQHVLAHHWPDVPRYGDITRVDWTTVEPVDLIAGGFPCQPFSFAGKQRGVEDERWLWPEFARAIRALRPRYVLVENVPGLLAGHGGMGTVIGDLADLGYDTEWDSVPAAAVGAPHLRYRVWIVGTRVEDTDRCPVESRRRRRRTPEAGELADADRRRSGGSGAVAGDGGTVPQEGSVGIVRRVGGGSDVAHTNDRGWTGGTGFLGARRWGELADGGGWSPEPNVGRVAHGVPARVDRLRALGNAVVPQVVEVIGRRLLDVIEAERAA